MARPDKRGKRRFSTRGRGRRLGWPRVVGELFLILLLSLLLLFTLGVGGITYMLGFRILPKINTVSFDELTARIATYQRYFDSLAERGAEVIYAPPYQVEGVRYFSWTVREPGKQGAVIYNWKYELETEEFTALTKEAYHLDQRLGFRSKPGFSEGEREAVAEAKGEGE